MSRWITSLMTTMLDSFTMMIPTNHPTTKENMMLSLFSSDDEVLEISMHSTAPLDPKKEKKFICHNKQFDQPDCQWSHDTRTRDANVSASSENPLQLFQTFFTNELYGLLAKKPNMCFMMKTRKTCNGMEESINKFLGVCITMVT